MAQPNTFNSSSTNLNGGGGVASSSTSAGSAAEVEHVSTTNASSSTAADNWNNREVSYEEVKRWSDAPDSDVIVIDVREAPDFERSHIPHSVNLPLTVFEQALAKNPERTVDFVRTYGFAKPATDAKIILYCRSGRRSTIAVGLAQGAGLTRVRNYRGSWAEYEGMMSCTDAAAGVAK